MHNSPIVFNPLYCFFLVDWTIEHAYAKKSMSSWKQTMSRCVSVLTWFPALDPEDSCLCCHKLPTILSNDFVTMSWGVGHFPCVRHGKNERLISVAGFKSHIERINKRGTLVALTAPDELATRSRRAVKGAKVQWSRINVHNETHQTREQGTGQVHNITRIFIYTHCFLCHPPPSICW